MPLFSRLTSLKRDVLHVASTLRRPSRLLARSRASVAGASFLAAFSLVFANPFAYPTVANDASSLNCAVCSLDANAAERPFPFFSRFQRPALLCELAGISDASLNWANNANEEPAFSDVPPLPTARVPYFTDVASSSAASPRPFFSPFSPSFPSSSTQSAPIVRGAYLSSLAIAPFRGRIFAYADGSWGRQDEQSESPFASGFDVASFGGGFGQDCRLTKNAIWGFGFQGRNVQIAPAASIYDAEIDSLAGFLRLSLFGPLWRLDLSIGAAQNWNEQKYGVGDRTKYSASQWNYEAEFGVRFDKGYTRVEPLINVRVITLQEPGAAERRLVAFERPSDYADASYRLKLGSRFSWEYATRLATLKPYLSATWAHEFGDRALYVVGENTPFPLVYRYAKHRMARDRLDLGGGVDAALRDTVDLFFRYDVEFAQEYANYLFYAGFHKKF